MNIKSRLKKTRFAYNLYGKIGRITSAISPRLNAEITYFVKHGTRLNLKKPTSFEEKLVWLKLNTYSNNPLVTKCIDKFRVREYLEEKEYEYLLNELYGVWDSPKEIEWNRLPEKFALKCNHGAGYNIICDSKKKLDTREASRQLTEWLNEDYYKMNGELNYKNVEKKIICEKYLDTDQGFLPWDYKLYCFNGEVKAILVMMDRENQLQGAFMTPEWEFISFPEKYKETKIPDKPASLDTMIKAATDLSSPFPFVRVDFYQYGKKAIFGELTFTPAGGIYVSKADINGVSMGEMLDITKEIKENNK